MNFSYDSPYRDYSSSDNTPKANEYNGLVHNAGDNKDSSKHDGVVRNKAKFTRRPVACKSCHSLKVKCIPVDDNNLAGPCVRCIKSKRKCEIDLNHARARRRKKETSSDPVAPSGTSVEESLVVARLRSENESLRSQLQQISQRMSDGLRTNSSKKDGNEYISKEDLEREMSILSEGESIKVAEMAKTLKDLARKRRECMTTTQNPDLISMGILTEDQANVMLNTYRKKILVYYPVIEIPESLTVAEMRHKSPFLLNAIIAVTSSVQTKVDDLGLALRIDAEAVKSIITEVLVMGTKSDELLKCLIILTLWYSLPDLFKHRHYHLLNIVSVCLLYDLGMMSKSQQSPEKTWYGDMANNPLREEHEKIVAVSYFISVSMSIILKRNSFISWSSYIEQCCSHLSKSNNKDLRNFALLAYLACHMERIHRTIHCTDTRPSHAMIEFMKVELSKDLLELKAKVSSDNHSFLSSYYSMEASLHEPVSINFSEGPFFSDEDLISFSKCSIACLNSINEFNLMGPDQLAGMPVMYLTRAIYVSGMLLRLRYLMLSVPRHVNRDLIPEKVIESLNRFSCLVKDASEKYPLNFYLKKLRLVFHLFTQTYVSQVQEFIRKNGDSPSSRPNFKLSEVDKLKEVMNNVKEDIKEDLKDHRVSVTRDTSALPSNNNNNGVYTEINNPRPSNDPLSIANMISGSLHQIPGVFANNNNNHNNNHNNNNNNPYMIDGSGSGRVDKLPIPNHGFDSTNPLSNDEFWSNFLNAESDKIDLDSIWDRPITDETYFMNI